MSLGKIAAYQTAFRATAFSAANCYRITWIAVKYNSAQAMSNKFSLSERVPLILTCVVVKNHTENMITIVLPIDTQDIPQIPKHVT